MRGLFEYFAKRPLCLRDRRRLRRSRGTISLGPTSRSPVLTRSATAAVRAARAQAVQPPQPGTSASSSSPVPGPSASTPTPRPSTSSAGVAGPPRHPVNLDAERRRRHREMGLYRERHLACLVEELEYVMAHGSGHPSEWATSFGLLGIPTQARYRRPDGVIITLDNCWRRRETEHCEQATQYDEEDFNLE